VLATHPGTMVIFNGDTLWHAVTPLEAGAERIILSMEYVTNPTMGTFQRCLSTLQDAIAYFGVAALVRRRRGPRHTQTTADPPPGRALKILRGSTTAKPRRPRIIRLPRQYGSSPRGEVILPLA
jgi:hypothetical protein